MFLKFPTTPLLYHLGPDLHSYFSLCTSVLILLRIPMHQLQLEWRLLVEGLIVLQFSFVVLIVFDALLLLLFYPCIAGHGYVSNQALFSDFRLATISDLVCSIS